LKQLLCNFQITKLDISKNKGLQSGHTKRNPQLKNPLQNKQKQIISTDLTTQFHHNIITQRIKRNIKLWHFIKLLQKHLQVIEVHRYIECGVDSHRVETDNGVEDKGIGDCTHTKRYNDGKCVLKREENVLIR